MKSLLSASSDRIEKITAEEELRASLAEKKARQELDSPESGRDGNRPLRESAGALGPSPETAKLAADYKLLGLRQGADLQRVEAAWRELAGRADPKRFPSGSEEEKRAGEILKSVNEAYARIREAINPTEGRFGMLEL